MLLVFHLEASSAIHAAENKATGFHCMYVCIYIYIYIVWIRAEVKGGMSGSYHLTLSHHESNNGCTNGDIRHLPGIHTEMDNMSKHTLPLGLSWKEHA